MSTGQPQIKYGCITPKSTTCFLPQRSMTFRGESFWDAPILAALNEAFLPHYLSDIWLQFRGFSTNRRWPLCDGSPSFEPICITTQQDQQVLIELCVLSFSMQCLAVPPSLLKTSAPSAANTKDRSRTAISHDRPLYFTTRSMTQKAKFHLCQDLNAEIFAMPSFV